MKIKDTIERADDLWVVMPDCPTCGASAEELVEGGAYCATCRRYFVEPVDHEIINRVYRHMVAMRES